jgi:AcrR family transcriptional regulator
MACGKSEKGGELAGLNTSVEPSEKTGAETCEKTGAEPAAKPRSRRSDAEGSGLHAAAGSIARADGQASSRRSDRRRTRTRRALRDALAYEIVASGGLDRVSVTAITERADVTRRTFYSHFKDIADLVEQSEAEVLSGLAKHIKNISQTNLDELSARLAKLEPCPGAVETLEYVKENGDYLRAMLGPGGDPALAEKIKRMAIDTVTDRALDGLSAEAAGPFFDYYLAFAVSAEVGVLQRWLERGMSESVEIMARIMTVLMFVRPGDLYGKPIDINLPMYALLLAQSNATSTTKESFR